MARSETSGRPDDIGAIEGQRQLLLALVEAVKSPIGGEVIIRSGRESGRVHVTGGRIAWANVSTVRTTFSERLTRHGLITMEDLRDVLSECRKTGSNFAETAIAWGLVTTEVLHIELFEHMIACLLEAFRLPRLQCSFSPIARTYSGTLLFSLEEVLDGVAGRGGIPELVARRCPGESSDGHLDRLDLECALERLGPASKLPLDLRVLTRLEGLLAASVTDRRGRAGFVGGIGDTPAQAVTPSLDRVLAAANYAASISGFGNVVGLSIHSSSATAVVQEFSEGDGLARCIFGPGSTAPLIRLQLEKILATLDESG